MLIKVARSEEVYPWKCVLIASNGEQYEGPEPAIEYKRQIYFKPLVFFKSINIKEVLLYSVNGFIYYQRPYYQYFIDGDTLKLTTPLLKYKITYTYKPNQNIVEYTWNGPEELFADEIKFKHKDFILNLFRTKEPLLSRYELGKTLLKIEVDNGI